MIDLPLPRDKYDTTRAEALVALDWVQLEPVVPHILEWLQDINWPVAAIFRPAMVSKGKRIAPCLRPILAADDDIWKFNILDAVVSQSRELATALRAELEDLAAYPTDSEQLEGVTHRARQILASLQ